MNMTPWKLPVTTSELQQSKYCSDRADSFYKHEIVEVQQTLTKAVECLDERITKIAARPPPVNTTTNTPPARAVQADSSSCQTGCPSSSYPCQSASHHHPHYCYSSSMFLPGEIDGILLLMEEWLDSYLHGKHFWS
jgi:hypothetical protein